MFLRLHIYLERNPLSLLGLQSKFCLPIFGSISLNPSSANCRHKGDPDWRQRVNAPPWGFVFWQFPLKFHMHRCQTCNLVQPYFQVSRLAACSVNQIWTYLLSSSSLSSNTAEPMKSDEVRSRSYTWCIWRRGGKIRNTDLHIWKLVRVG